MFGTRLVNWPVGVAKRFHVRDSGAVAVVATYPKNGSCIPFFLFCFGINENPIVFVPKFSGCAVSFLNVLNKKLKKKKRHKQQNSCVLDSIFYFFTFFLLKKHFYI